MMLMDVMTDAVTAQRMIRSDSLSAFVVLEGLAICALFVFLLRAYAARISDRDAFQAKMDAIARDSLKVVSENTATMMMVVRGQAELAAKRRPTGRHPAAVAEPEKKETG